jgi:Tfp pilus assembly protein PilF
MNRYLTRLTINIFIFILLCAGLIVFVFNFPKVEKKEEYEVGNTGKYVYVADTGYECKKANNEKLSIGHKYIKEMNFDKAMSVYRDVLNIDSNCKTARVGLAMVYYYKGEYQNAKDQYHIALKLDPYDAWVIQSLGVVAHKLDGPDSAIQYYKNALEINKDLAIAQWGIGINYIETKNFFLAKKHLLKFIELDPMSANAIIAKKHIQNMENNKY